MSFKVENMEEKNMVKLVIEATAEEFEAGLNTAFNKNKNKISVPGFRKGKAPRKMVEKLYGTEIFYEDAANAIDVLCYGIAKFVGGYVAAMNGVDAIVFTAGIGENAIPVREKVVSYLGYLGVTLDKEANGVRGEEIVISTPDSKVKVAVIPTNEELAICRETVALV